MNDSLDSMPSHTLGREMTRTRGTEFSVGATAFRTTENNKSEEEEEAL